MPPDPELPNCGDRWCAHCPKRWARNSTCIQADAIQAEAIRLQRTPSASDQRFLDTYDLAHPDEIWSVIAPDTES